MERNQNVMVASAALSMRMMVIIMFGSTHVLGGGVYANTDWTDSHATFYGGSDGGGTMGGACGYGNLLSRGYGLQTAALSSTLFNNGLTCGACFEIKCKLADTKWCYPNAGSIKITATNLCPANPARPTNRGGWCNPPRTHFDLSVPMFTKLAKYVAGIIPVQFRRIPCVKSGGIRFVMNGNPWFNLVLVYNVGGGGNVVSMQMKGSRTNWFGMRHNWGQNWELSHKLQGQAVSFRATLGDGKQLVANDVAFADWRFGQTFEDYKNF